MPASVPSNEPKPMPSEMISDDLYSMVGPACYMKDLIDFGITAIIIPVLILELLSCSPTAAKIYMRL